jgi:hypothetical protein
MRFLLRTRHLDVLQEFCSLSAVRQLGIVARFEVAAVTGANAYFSLSQSDVNKFGLTPWARPLLARIRHAPGLIFDDSDHLRVVDRDGPAFLFDASRTFADPHEHRGLRSYLDIGEAQGIPQRYKCRIREPWYAIPYIKHGELLLSKRCHRYPRLIMNATQAITTDTIYRGRLVDRSVDARTLVAGFHNSGTLLSAELEGRNFGGGVLELVPSEVSRVRIPVAPAIAKELERLDKTHRDVSGSPQPNAVEELVRETDLLLVKADIGVSTAMIDDLAEARSVLLGRRLERSTGRVPDDL